MSDRDRDAKVRLELAAGGFLSMLKEIERQAGELAQEVEGIGDAGAKAEKKLSPMLGSLKKGVGAAKDSLVELGSSLKSTLAQAATLGGALSVGAGVHTALEVVDAYKDIAFAVQNSTGKAFKWQQVQQDVEASAKRWKIANSEVANSYLELFKTTEDLDFTRAAMESVGRAHRATGANVQTLTSLANELNEKFGVTADKIDDAMVTLIGTVPGGKAGLEELGDKLGLLGASARGVGLEGEAGLKKVLGMLNLAGSGGGSFKKELMSVIQLLETLGDSDQVKRIEKTLGHGTKLRDKEGKTKAEALEIIMRQTGGKHEELSKVFSGPLLRFTSELGKTYEKTFAETAGDTKAKTAAATKALSQAMEAAGKSTLTSAELQRQATERLQDPKAQLQDAMNTFKRAFTKPEVIASMEKLAALLPRVAGGMADLVEFASDHPWAAGAGLLGGKVGGAVGGSVATDVAGAFGSAAKGKAVQVGDAIAKAASAHPGWAAAGKAMALAAAAYAGWEAGKAIVDSRIDDKSKLQNDVITAGAEAHAAALSGDKERMGKARDTLKERIRQMEKDRGGIGGAFDTVMGGLVTVMPGGDPNFVAPEAKQLATASRDLKELERAMAKGAKGGDKAGESLDRMAKGVDRVVGVLNKIQTSGGGGGNNGLPPAPGNQSGSDPK